MEVAISAVTSELVTRFISFLMDRYRSTRARSEEKAVETLQRLLMRVSTVVEEADGRYITNSGMLMQLKMLSEAMYRAYHVLDAFRYQAHEEKGVNKIMHLELHRSLETLEIVMANMAEFVVLLGGCERLSRRPYDAYLYTDNFMFGRHAEKQKLLSFLLQHNPPGHAPAVLPIIGSIAVGKKTLVAHVCGDERVRSRFASVVHLNGDSLLRVLDLDQRSTMSGMILVIVKLDSDVADEDWNKFHSFVKETNTGSKVIIVSRHQRTARFGSVKPIFLNPIPYEEFWYLFKTLAFGSADMAQYPRLVRIAEEFAKELQSGGSLVAANAVADVLRTNLNIQFWHCMLSRHRRVIQKNISVHGAPPNLHFQQGHTIDITDFALHASSPIRIAPCTRSSNMMKNDSMKTKSRKVVTLRELLVNPTGRPKEEFSLLTWESRMPPYSRFAHLVESCSDHDLPQDVTVSGRKRQGAPV
ncbi:hypothetical protein BRADI_1g34370v3 [Brachypodium distachyon]|uniref:Disease resistance N-terminal domain-containing protein n=1 Tax=Brachypodium distachyon TaxID=15368 RepID=A0A2K2DMP7_BRADI|nr:hypothetical protein BRADI_1g34370v3 [Brachypodium distachyon]